MLSLSSINSNDIVESIRDTNEIVYSLLSLSLLSNEIHLSYIVILVQLFLLCRIID